MSGNIDPVATTLLVAIAISIVAVLTIIVLAVKLSRIKRSDSVNQRNIAQLQEQVGQVQGQFHQLQLNVQTKAQELYQSWMQRDCESIRANEREIARKDALTQLDQWRFETEVSIRNYATQRSHSVILGQVSEHLAPYMPEFSFNPKDVRFVGSPIDLIVFDGMDEENLREIVFVEVKTGSSAALTSRERQIRDVVSARQVKWLELRIKRDAPMVVGSVTELPTMPGSQDSERQIQRLQEEKVKLQAEMASFAKEFARTLRKTMRQNRAVAESVVGRLVAFNPENEVADDYKHKAIAAWRDNRFGWAAQMVYEMVKCDPKAIPFIESILTSRKSG